VINGGAEPDPDAPAGDVTPGEGREWVYQRKDGSTVPVNEAITLMNTGDGEASGYLTVAYDITKRIEAQAEVRHMAHHDVLTGLPNRTTLLNHLVESLAQCEIEGSELVVLLLDLDHFKRVNDSLGHPVGDELLLRMAERLRTCVREDDVVARLGGDEFVVVFGPAQADEDLAQRIDELMRAVQAPIDVHGHELIVTASLGGATYPRDGKDPATLLKNADTAMYHAKTAGRNDFQWFFESMLDETNDKIALTASLRQALGRSELSVVYQPQINLESGAVVGMEALARWDSAEHGSVAPERFIPVAEDSGMITELGEWVLRKACREAVVIEAELGRKIRLAVNVSPRQFRQRDWLGVVISALDDSGFDPSSLDLEITEGILMENPQEVIEVLHALRKLGVGIVVDDFGTGFSSLAYLTRFPIDKIKIDRSFVRDITVDDADAAIVDTIIVMAHTLGMVVVAEGIETDAQEHYLRERGCDEAQGFRYAAGRPVDQLVGVVRSIGSSR
jgi:diguanylate cyclase (GGDEF)-like protein